jgi:hypothetical protein
MLAIAEIPQIIDMQAGCIVLHRVLADCWSLRS